MPDPYCQQATSLGYYQKRKAGCTTEYVKNGRPELTLTVSAKGTASLYTHYGEIEVAIRNFVFPNDNFPSFESQLIEFYLAAEKEEKKKKK